MRTREVNTNGDKQQETYTKNPHTDSSIPNRPENAQTRGSIEGHKPGEIAFLDESVESNESIEVFEAKASPNNTSEWVRQELPSKGLPYKQTDVFVRPLTVMIVSRIAAASKQNSFTKLLDALNNCIESDIRDLTPEDFNFLMYWWRDNSFPRAPLRLYWVSRYGNQNELVIDAENLEFEELKLSKEELQKYQDKGLCFPTVRDMELLRNESGSEDEQWILENAQYIRIDTPKDYDYRNYIEDKKNRFEELGLGIVAEINDFVEKIDHGVRETIQTTDAKFDPEVACKYLRETAMNMLSVMEESYDGKENARSYIPAVVNKADDFVSEANTIEAALAEGKKVEPREENVGIAIAPTDFFSGIRF